ncbi:hypothetical protein [Brevundimonas sp.]|uniref:hypothetical protein n=1 Tax=Brevundimonas sp. TaxID=1871086 RepID=UPI003BA970CF
MDQPPSAAPRITFTRATDGLLEIWLNPQGRDLLVEQLLRLSPNDDHHHIMPEGDAFADIPTRSIAYVPGDEVFEFGKVLFRLDEWDAEYFPHVLTVPDVR